MLIESETFLRDRNVPCLDVPMDILIYICQKPAELDIEDVSILPYVNCSSTCTTHEWGEEKVKKEEEDSGQ